MTFPLFVYRSGVTTAPDLVDQVIRAIEEEDEKLGVHLIFDATDEVVESRDFAKVDELLSRMPVTQLQIALTLLCATSCGKCGSAELRDAYAQRLRVAWVEAKGEESAKRVVDRVR